MEQRDKQVLYDRAEDMLRRTARGEVTRSRFLSPAEAHALSAYLLRGGHTKDCFFYGGYPEAERTRLFLLPGYLTDFLGADTERGFSFEEPEEDEHTAEGYPVGLIDSYTDGAVTESITALYVKGSGYRDRVFRGDFCRRADCVVSPGESEARCERRGEGHAVCNSERLCGEPQDSAGCGYGCVGAARLCGRRTDEFLARGGADPDTERAL